MMKFQVLVSIKGKPRLTRQRHLFRKAILVGTLDHAVACQVIFE